MKILLMVIQWRWRERYLISNIRIGGDNSRDIAIHIWRIGDALRRSIYMERIIINNRARNTRFFLYTLENKVG